MQSATRTLCVIALLIAGSNSAMAQTIRELEARQQAERAALDSLKTRLAAQDSHLQRARPESQEEMLEHIARDMAQVEEALRAVQNTYRELAQRIGSTEQRLRQAQDQLKTLERDMARRVRERYKLGHRGILAMLFSSRSLGDAAQRVRYLSRLADRDQRDLQALRAARKRVSLFYQIHSSQQRRQQILAQRERANEQVLKRWAADKAQILKQRGKRANGRSGE